MKTYKCHKIVQAGVITGADFYRHRLKIEGEKEVISVPDGFFARGTPKAGDYLVKYPGGYLSWSPKIEFEEGYSEIEG